MEEKIVSQGHLNGHNYIIRYPQMSDVASLVAYINDLSREKTFVRFQGEEMTMTEETEYMEKNMKEITEKKSAKLLLYIDETLCGISGVDMRDKIQKHVGIFGITIKKEYRSLGFGRLLTKLLLKEAILTVPDLRIIELGVFEENKTAISLYKSLGFQEYGRLPGGFVREGRYTDHVLMYKLVV